MVLPLASNEMSWVLTHAQFTQSIHLNKGLDAVLPNKRKVTKARASLSFMETALPSPWSGRSKCFTLLMLTARPVLSYARLPFQASFSWMSEGHVGLLVYCLTEETGGTP